MKGDESAKVFQEGFNCAQSVLIPFAKDHGLSEGSAARMAASFGAGMGRSQESCGAVTGGLMALGLKYGFEKSGDKAGKDRSLALTRAFLAGFKARFGSTLCKELLGGCDLNTPEGQKMHKDLNQRELICMNCVRYAASTIDSMKAE